MELFRAVEQGDLVKTKSLLESRSGDEKTDLINSSNSSGLTLLHVASQKGNLDLVKYLLHLGAEVSKPGNKGDTALHYACRKGHIHVAKYLIKRGADVDTGTESPLVVASREGHFEVVEYLLNAGADVNKRANDGVSPLYVSSYRGHLDIIKCLVTRGAELDLSNDYGITPLYTASLNGQYDAVKYLVNAGADVNKAKSNGDIPVYAASREGHFNIVQYLITKGANPAMTDRAGQTPLYIASKKGHLGVVESLVNAGVDVNKTTKDGKTPLLAAVREGHHYIAKYLTIKEADLEMADRAGKTPLYIASQKGDLGVVESLVDAGADVNKASDDGDTPLLAALRADKLDIAKYLITTGAYPDMTDSAGKTPLYIASQLGYLGVTEALVNAGADVNKTSSDGNTPLLVASLSGDIDIAKYLLTKRADPDLTDSACKTPLYIASQKGYLGVTEALVNAGADMNKTSNNGDTPLIAALHKDHNKIAKYLIATGANPDMTDRAGNTPLKIVSQKGYLGLIESLVNAKADVNKASKDGDTPLIDALRKGHHKIAKYLLTKGAYPDMTDWAGNTPLYIASQRGDRGVIEALVNAGADVNKTSYHGHTPLFAALRNGHRDVAKYFIGMGTTLDFANKKGDTSFSLALEEGHLGFAEYLAIAEADMNEAPLVSTASLHVASRHGHVNVSKYLIRISPDVDKMDKLGFTSLHYAVQNGHLGIVKCLVDAGADVNSVSSSGNIGLHGRDFYHFAAKRAEAERVSISGITPLHLASQAGHLRIVEYLVQAGAAVNIASDSDNAPWDTTSQELYLDHHGTELAKANINMIKGITPLHLAAQAGHLNIVEYLVQAGADVNKGSGSDNAPRRTERYFGHNDTQRAGRVDRVSIKGIAPLHLASYAGHLSIVEYLVQAGANVNQASVDGITPLHAALNACLLDKPSYIRRNLQGLDVGMIEYITNIPSFYAALPEGRYGIGLAFALRTTQLHTLSKKSYLDVVRYLVTKQAEVDKSNRFGVTPLQLASLAGHLGAVECLVDARADVNKAAMSYNLPTRQRRYTTLRPEGNTHSHKTPLYIASEEGHLGILQCLLKSGADINMALENGDTPLHAASNESHYDVVKYLTTTGANLNACNNKGITPIHAASLKGNLKIVEYLVEAGANVNTVSSLGEGPLHAASRMDHHDVVQYLSEVCKYRSTLTDQGGFQRSPTQSVFYPALLDVGLHTHGPSTSSTSSEKDQMTKPLAETSRARRSTSLGSSLDKEDDQYYQSRSTDEQTNTINLEEYHIVAKIPTGEQGVNDITIQVIEKAPSDLVLKEDEAIIAVGLKFSPPGLHFSSPLKVTLPHSAIFTNPRKASIVLYMRNNDFNKFSKVSSSADGTPRCVVRQDDLDLYIDHFSEWWIITYLWETFIGKRLMCTPYIPLLRPKNVTQCIIIGIKDDVKGAAEIIPHYEAVLPGTQFLVRWRCGKLNIAYLLDDEEKSHQSMEEKEFYHLNNHMMYFRLEPDILQVMVEFILSQYITKRIMFPLLTQEEEISPTQSCTDTPQCCTASHSDHGDDKSLVDTQEVTEAHLLKLSKLLPPGSFSEVYVAFKISSVIAKCTLAEKMYSYPETYMELLLMWKRKSARTLKELDEVLVKADLGGLRPEYKRP